MDDIVPVERIASKIYVIRQVKVMLDRDLAELYGVETSQLKRAVRRNIDRFPDDFMFELTKEELKDWRCQFGTSNSEKMGLENLRCQTGTSSWGGSRYAPMVFTEQGVAMLSSVLSSKQAIHVNIQIMRTFTKLRQAILNNEDLKKELLELKQLTEERFKVVFEALDQLLTVEYEEKKKIGFTVKEKQSGYGNSGDSIFICPHKI